MYSIGLYNYTVTFSSTLMCMGGSGVVFSFVITTNFSVNTPEIPFSRYKHPFILYIKPGVENVCGCVYKF